MPGIVDMGKLAMAYTHPRSYSEQLITYAAWLRANTLPLTSHISREYKWLSSYPTHILWEEFQPLFVPCSFFHFLCVCAHGVAFSSVSRNSISEKPQGVRELFRCCLVEPAPGSKAWVIGADVSQEVSTTEGVVGCVWRRYGHSMVTNVYASG